MFPTTCATTTSLSDPTTADDRPTMPGRSPSVGGISSRAIGFPGLMFVTSGVSPAGCLGPSPYHPSPGSNVHSIFWGTSGLLPLINLFLSHLLTLPTRTLPPCRQHRSTVLIIIKILLMPLMGPDNPLPLSLPLLLPKVGL